MDRDFRIYVDRGGNMPQLRYKKWRSATHPYYIRYSGDHPVALKGPVELLAEDITKTKVFSYAQHDYVSMANIPQE